MNETGNNVPETNTVVGGDTMAGFVTELTESVTTASMFDTVAQAAPIVVIAFTVGFGLYILRRALRGAQKGKAKV